LAKTGKADDDAICQECIAPWLMLKSTCPLDRKELVKKDPPPPLPTDDDEEEWDEQYG
jgi:hypothetical protein